MAKSGKFTLMDRMERMRGRREGGTPSAAIFMDSGFRPFGTAPE